MLKDSAIILDYDMTVIFEHITNKSNVYVSSSLFGRSPLVIFYQLLSVWRSRIPPKNI